VPDPKSSLERPSIPAASSTNLGPGVIMTIKREKEREKPTELFPEAIGPTNLERNMNFTEARRTF